jgi:hypothetical protein
VVKDEKIIDDHLDYFGYFFIKRISVCLARLLSWLWLWVFRVHFTPTPGMGYAPGCLLQGVLLTTQLLWARLLLQRSLSRMGARPLGE